VIEWAVERAVAAVRERIAEACDRAGRDPAGVRLVAATKSVPVEAIRRAAGAGVTDFGENYVQELERKREAGPEATWHFLGRLQSNKVRRVLDAADVVQTLEPGRAADRLSRRVAEGPHGVRCLVQVDLTGSRVGVSEAKVEEFLQRLESSALEPFGLMTVAPLGRPARAAFRRLRELRDRVRERSPTVEELSMGMSADLEEAVEEGATMVRVGTAIFGHRP
jgi:PLP dependent protein